MLLVVWVGYPQQTGVKNLHYLLQVCAANFGEFCSIVGQEATEKLLVRLHHYVTLTLISFRLFLSQVLACETSHSALSQVTCLMAL